MHDMRGRKGSFTVELACLMPLILLVILGSIYLCLFVHNRAWLTAAAWESVLAGSQEVRSGRMEEAARERGKMLLSPRLFGAENLQMQVAREGKKLEVQFDADTVASYGGLAWHLRVRADGRIADPVAFIWQVRGLAGLADSLQGE